jgi:hypothetical protein
LITRWRSLPQRGQAATAPTEAEYVISLQRAHSKVGIR